MWCLNIRQRVNENEKMTFVQKPLEYLIEQIEYNGPNLISVKNEQSLRMKFKIDNSFLVKELIWICKEQNPEDLKNYFNFWHNNSSGKNRTDHFKNGSLLLNGRVLNPRFPASYYRMVQRNQFYKSDYTLMTNNRYLDEDDNTKNNCIYSYSFNLDPENVSSSGFLSFKKFNNKI